jgi:dipeptidyl aminopeptidase/acylaminoacyl peptidase
MTRPARPEDLYRLRIATDPRLSPDGRWVAFTVQQPSQKRDGYRHSIWLAPVDGSVPPRQITIGAKHDRHPRFSPDGSLLAFLSDRRTLVEDEPGAADDREDGVQVHVLPLDGGEARRVTDLPRGVDGFAWSPDGKRLAVLSSSRGATKEADARRRGIPVRKPAPDEPPVPDYRYLDRLSYMLNGEGFVQGREPQLWLADLDGGEPRRLTRGDDPIAEPAWSPDGSRIAFTADRRSDRDMNFNSQVHVVDVESGRETRVTDAGRAAFGVPAWLPDGTTLAIGGHRWPARAGSRNDIWLFAADGSDSGRDGGRNLSARHDLMPGSTLNSDVTPGEPVRLAVTADGRWITFSAPYGGSYELWRISTDDGRIVRLTEDRHYISAFDQVSLDGRSSGTRIAYARSTPTETTDFWAIDLSAAEGAGWSKAKARRITELNRDVLAELDLVEPVERWVEVDGRSIQGWYMPPAAGSAIEADGKGRRGRTADVRASSKLRRSVPPLVTEIHGGPHTLYGWSPFWEFQVLAGSGIGVFYSNPRGSEGYGEAFNAANFRDWGPGPTRDVLAGVEALVDERLADRDRLGVTGGSYGGYLTNWIVGHDDRFAAAATCRSVVDLPSQFLSGDIAGPTFAEIEFGATPWEDPVIFRDQSPISLAPRIRTPLLVQHSERDLRCTVTQAEQLFSVLRSHRRQVRLMRVPDESHELTRSGTPFRRVENLVQVRDWFAHYLLNGGRRLPPLPKDRAGK